jgi:hypothetical protein
MELKLFIKLKITHEAHIKTGHEGWTRTINDEQFTKQVKK